MPPLMREVKEIEDIETILARAMLRTENRVAAIEQAVDRVHAILLSINEVLRMSIDPTVQKIADDAATMKTAVDAAVSGISDLKTQNAALQAQIATMQANGGLSAENAAALQAAAATMESTISEAQAAVAPAAPSAPPAADGTTTPAA